MQPIKETSSKLTSSSAQSSPSDMMDDQNSKLTEIRNLAKTVADQQLKINKLEKQNGDIFKSVAEILKQSENISTEVNGSKCELKKASYYPSPEIIISSVPAQFNMDPREIVNSVLQILDVPQSMADVLEARLI
ncbi:hypothetical protein PV326_012202 [Microctonus aethiopoides]|nr:hypothetical protein PV326_012202 [Microctonus aethiopoides]